MIALNFKGVSIKIVGKFIRDLTWQLKHTLYSIKIDTPVMSTDTHTDRLYFSPDVTFSVWEFLYELARNFFFGGGITMQSLSYADRRL